MDSPHALDQLDRCAAAAAADAEAVLRVNGDEPVPGQGLAMAGVASQFGADEAWIREQPWHFACRSRVTVVGLHLYMGTNLTDVGDLMAQFRRAVGTASAVAQVLAPHGVRLRILDLGGGFGAPFARGGRPVDLAGLRDPLTALLDADLPGWRSNRPRVVFESGRYLVASCGTL